ncbi:MAG TPA: hypothetical protein VMR70_01680 [Flavisolibacter sp.]|nr:hypothetical protein [Flavisolibacter sp.]
MKKLTLKFSSFRDLSGFMKQLSGGYLINTNTLTITADFHSYQIQIAEEEYGGYLVETSERVYSYDPI